MIITRFVFITLLFISITSCSDKFNEEKEIRTNCKQGASLKKVLIVGWDGVRTDALLAAETPNLDSLLKNSIYTFNCDRGPFTVSVPGWSSLLHGVWPDKHNLRENSFRKNRFDEFPDIVKILKGQRPELSAVVLSNWDDFLRITSNEDYAQRYDNDWQVTNAANALIGDCSSDIFVLHYDFPDYIGHSIGFSPTSIEYLNSIEITDYYLGEILENVYWRESNLNEEWLVVVTTDHGGEGTGHGGQDDLPQTRNVWAVLRFPNQSQIEIPSFKIVDVLPTILKWFGVNPNSNLDGTSLN